MGIKKAAVQVRTAVVIALCLMIEKSPGAAFDYFPRFMLPGVLELE